MDIQLKRGLLDVCVLAAIKNEDSYGYQIIKDLSRCITVSESTLYPILRRLESAGSLRVYNVEHNGRLRKMYAITPAGKTQIQAFLDGWQEIAAIYHFIREANANEA